MKVYDAIVIGAGTAGLSARREVANFTNNYLVIDDGPLGTTCARVGCMPSKALIQVANDYHRRHALSEMGIQGGSSLSIDRREAMKHVRKLRDRFVRSVLLDLESWTTTHLRRGRARILSPTSVQVGDDVLNTRSIIVATGSRPILPSAWSAARERLIDTDKIFELETLPQKMAVIGLGVIGLELGQALHRLGVEVKGFGLGTALGGLTDPELQEYAIRHFKSELPLDLSGVQSLAIDSNGLKIETQNSQGHFELALVAIGRKPAVAGLGLENLGVEIEQNGLPQFDRQTMQVSDLPVFIVGDVNGDRTILHEAADEGKIAGFNAMQSAPVKFERRAGLAITFTDPNLAISGESHTALVERKADFATGSASYEGQGRAIIQLKEKGLLHVYGDKKTGRLLGAEMMAPGGEHLAHLLSWVIQKQMSVHEVLALPFYHPVVEEGLRTALRHLQSQVEAHQGPLEIPMTETPLVLSRTRPSGT